MLPEGAPARDRCGEEETDDCAMDSTPPSVPSLMARFNSDKTGVLMSAGSTARARAEDPSLLMAICRTPPLASVSDTLVMINESSETDDAIVLDSSLDRPDGEGGADDCCCVGGWAGGELDNASFMLVLAEQGLLMTNRPPCRVGDIIPRKVPPAIDPLLPWCRVMAPAGVPCCC